MRLTISIALSLTLLGLPGEGFALPDQFFDDQAGTHFFRQRIEVRRF